MPEAYCVKCKAKREMKNAKEVTMNGKGGKKKSGDERSLSKVRHKYV